MIKYFLKRVLQIIPMTIVISMIIFLIISMTPGDPVGTNLDLRATPEQKAEERARLGLDDPIPVRYVKWLGRTFQGDFGQSSLYKKPVKDVIGPFILNSFKLNIVVFLITFIIAIPIGIASAKYKGGIADNIITVTSYAGVSFPTFFIGLLLIYIFSIQLGVTPISGMLTPGANYIGFAKFQDTINHMILPALTLIITSMPRYVRYVRMNMLNAINQDYIRTARAKGLSEKVVIYSHAFRNSLISIVTLFGFEIPLLFSGAAILEAVFNWPGIGRVMMDSVTNRDYNLMMAILIFFAILTLIGNLIADMLYVVVDPRIKPE